MIVLSEVVLPIGDELPVGSIEGGPQQVATLPVEVDPGQLGGVHYGDV